MSFAYMIKLINLIYECVIRIYDKTDQSDIWVYVIRIYDKYRYFR